MAVYSYFHKYKNSLFAEAEKKKTPNKKSLIHRMVLVATINPNLSSFSDQHTAITEHYKQLVSKFQKTPQIGITGLLLLYPKCIIHLLESSSDVLTLILKDLSDTERGSNSLLKDCRILALSHCLKKRAFSSWIYRTFHPEKSQSPTRSVEMMAAGVLAQVYKHCTGLVKQVNSEGQDVPMAIEEESVIQLCQSGALHSPTSFLRSSTKPVSTPTDSEIVRPTQQRLFWQTD